ncbi:hypothetical protein BG011_004330 [Mortierella polycephala]|uniref:Lytic polysaccharide monooxygenase n=1 Tax=Mortierella polycephala TaxID=41804 RepID=A0A9P6U1R1_9FUNG|nr:hypothetical protein BG011_004330 [Mortierella polycephala]
MCEAHVGLKRPCARGSLHAGCPAPSNGQPLDYDLNAPIGTYDEQTLPYCRTSIPSATRTVYNSGQNIRTEYALGAIHNGGHCQWAISYDDGKTWVVIKTWRRNCLRNASYDKPYIVNVKIPDDAPSGKAIFMWLWNNASGVRELYSNCADIEIKGKSGGKLKGLEPLIANYGSKSMYIPEFPTASNDDKGSAFSQRKSITVSTGSTQIDSDPICIET